MIARLPDLGRRTLTMGILNVTPDSFSDGGRFDSLEEAERHALRLQEEGAAILDIGGESTRPGHIPVSAEDERERVLPILKRLRGRLSIPISIDTYKASTAEAALRAGAAIINDIWGLMRDPDMARVAASHGAPVVIMHNRETVDPDVDIIADMKGFFARAIDRALKAGLPHSDIILDPGIGFGKSQAQHLEALRRLPEIVALGYPVLAGVSRKSILGSLRDQATAPRDRLFGSIGAHVSAAMLGARIMRVHDVAAHVEALRVADAILGLAPPEGARRP